MGSSANDPEVWRPGDAYNGALDDVRFYSRVLTPEEISAIYQGATAIDEDAPAVPMKFELAQNFPNPFNPTTQIEYTLNNNTNVQITVYDLLGHEIATLVNEKKNAGSHSVVWDASGQSAGIYLYQMKTGNQILTRKMVLLK
jgi:hypothetical protein